MSAGSGKKMNRMKNGWKRLSHKLLFKNKFGYRLWRDDVVLPSKKKTFFNYIERKRGYVGIVPVTKDGKVCLLKSFRFSLNKYLYEIPLGYIDPKETPLETAKRELRQEIGATAKKWVSLGWAWQAPGFLKLKSHFFLAKDVIPGKQDLEETEDLELFTVSPRKIKQMLDKSIICDSSSIIPLMRALKYLQE